VLPIIFGILSAAGFGASVFLIQVGLRSGRVTPVQGMFVNLVAGNVLLLTALAIALTGGPMVLHWQGIMYFVAAGISAPLLGRVTIFYAIRHVGSTRAASLAISESLFAGPLAFLFLGQHISWLSGVGIVVIVVGTVLFISETRQTLSTDDGLELVEDGTTAPEPTGQDVGRRVGVGVIMALLSGFFFAVAGIFRQYGVDSIPSALLGTAIGTFVALLVSTVGLSRRPMVMVSAFRVPRRDLLCFIGSGSLSSVAMLCFFWALDANGTVAISTALKNTSSIFTFFFALIFLARKERVSVRLGVLVVTVALGAGLAALGRG
jgi:drug/metabolite transporter (DMT)-like permease